MAFLHDLFRPKKEEAKSGGIEGPVSVPQGEQEFLAGQQALAEHVPASEGSQRIESLIGGKLTLLLDDVLARVPTRALKPGLHDPSRELHFEMEELLDGISRGRATIMLSKLAERYPETFQAPANPADDAAIFLPLQKLIQQIGRASRRAPERVAAAEMSPPVAVPPPTPAESVVAPVPVEEKPAPAREEPAQPKPNEEKPVPVAEAFLPGAAAPPAAATPPAQAPAARPLRKLEVLPTRPVEPKPEPKTSEPLEAASVVAPEVKLPAHAEAEPPKPVFAGDPSAVKFEPFGGVRATSVSTFPEPTPAPEPPKAEREPEQVAPPPAVSVPPPLPTAEERLAAKVEPPAPTPPVPPEPAVRFATGRPMVRPPSIHGPAGIVTPEAEPPAAPPVPGFVFAPRPSSAMAEMHAPPLPSEQPMPEVHMPPLFPHHENAPAEAAQAPAEPAPTPPPISLAPPVEEKHEDPAPIPEPAPLPPPAEELPADQTDDAPAEIPPAGAVDEPAAAEPAEEPTPETSAEHPEEPGEPGEQTSAEPEAAEERQISPAPREGATRSEGLLGVHFSLARINQEPLQAIFMTEEFLDLPRVSQLSCGFPGVTGCMIVAGDTTSHGGERPAGLDAKALCQLTKQLAATSAEFPEELPAVQTYTLHTGNRALSIFARQHVTMCVVHSHRGFLPGVRERLAAVADTLARGLADDTETDTEWHPGK